MREVVALALLITLVWVVLISLLCYRATRRFVTGFFLSLGTATVPAVLILTLSGDVQVSVRWLLAFMAFAVIPCAVVGLLFVLSRHGRRPMDRSHCVKCGYDLTGNVSGVCPECGEPCR